MSDDGDAAIVASLFAVDAHGLGGVCLRSQAHAQRRPWLELLRGLVGDAPVRRIPFNLDDDRLLGGLDLAATLRLNRPMLQQGVLAGSDGGVVVVSMAERLSARTGGCLCAALDDGAVTMARDAMEGRFPARIGIVALDEGIEDERIPDALLDRMAFLLELDGLSHKAILSPLHEAADIAAARARLPLVRMDDQWIRRLCGTAMALGVASPRVTLLATRVARIAAALEGRAAVTEQDAILAGRLVLAPRATQVPPESEEAQRRDEPASHDAPETREAEQRSDVDPSDQAPNDGDTGNSTGAEQPAAPQTVDPADRVLAATQAAIPAGLLARLAIGTAAGRSKSSGRFGDERRGVGRGRPAGVQRGTPRGNARLNVLETLRAAAPWQRLRGRDAARDPRPRIHAGDCRVTQRKQRSRTLTIFVVDASGSSAMHRLAEAKGAVELLLAECYLRRDLVAVIAFRGRTAQLVLPPTRSLVRAKRSLEGMPGGGATPLAAALDGARILAQGAQRQGESVTVVLLSDGRANIGRDGGVGREAAHRDALAAALGLRTARIATLFIDTSPRPSALAQSIAAGMNARYVPLPQASSREVLGLVRHAAANR